MRQIERIISIIWCSLGQPTPTEVILQHCWSGRPVGGWAGRWSGGWANTNRAGGRTDGRTQTVALVVRWKPLVVAYTRPKYVPAMEHVLHSFFKMPEETQTVEMSAVVSVSVIVSGRVSVRISVRISVSVNV